MAAGPLLVYVSRTSQMTWPSGSGKLVKRVHHNSQGLGTAILLCHFCLQSLLSYPRKTVEVVLQCLKDHPSLQIAAHIDRPSCSRGQLYRSKH